MVYFQPPTLDRTFAALADPTRRAILDMLRMSGTRTAGEIAAPFSMSLAAVLKHLGVLAGAGLIQREKIGRTVRCTLDPGPMQDAQAWIDHYQRFWTARLDALASYVEENSPCPPQSTRASRSSGASKRRSRRSSRPGRAERR